jgi:UDP-2-acetamido-3-amino-2,3-dideoxy-glucuronate N-acetyltransferase
VLHTVVTTAPELTKPARPSFYVHPSAEVHASTAVGAGTKIWHQAQVRENVCIGENCVISKDVYIDIGVHIGNGVKVQNGVSIYRGVILEDDTFVGPHAAFTNDMTPRSFADDWEIVPTRVRRGAAIGANATIVCGVTLGPYCMVGAGSTVTHDVPPHALVVGSPARVVSYICRRGHRMEPDNPLDYESCYRCVRCDETLRVTVCVTWNDPVV